MTKRWLGRLAWLAPLVVLAGILVLVIRVDVPTWAGPGPSVGGRLTALVSCVLPVATDDPPSAPAAAPEAPAPDCDATRPDRLGTPRMTAC